MTESHPPWNIDAAPHSPLGRGSASFIPMTNIHAGSGAAIAASAAAAGMSTSTVPPAPSSSVDIASHPLYPNHSHPHQQQYFYHRHVQTLAEEFWASTDHIFASKWTWLLCLGPIAIFGDSTRSLSAAGCFACSGIALIPCAERLSFVTEQVSLHTNGTIGALLNATFGNAPELLISVAALRSGFYRVVQLAMLGSMITNMIFVFGVSCLIGGLRWQVQTIRQVSGNVSVGMLLVATAGSCIPATLILSGHFRDQTLEGVVTDLTDVPTQKEVTLSRVNAAVMLILYICYIVFQLGTHKDEFDEALPDRHHSAPPNVFCRGVCARATRLSPDDGGYKINGNGTSHSMRGVKKRSSSSRTVDDFSLPCHPQKQQHGGASNTILGGDFVAGCDDSYVDEDEMLLHNADLQVLDDSIDESGHLLQCTSERRRRRGGFQNNTGKLGFSPVAQQRKTVERVYDERNNKLASFDSEFMSVDDDAHIPQPVPVISMRVGIIWLFIITICVSAMSDILVDTIDGFAQDMKLSQVFTSMVIVPFFSNVAEQVTAFIFAYRNEMDLVVGVTIGSAIQIATFVLPGGVLIGLAMDKAMTLYFHGYETVCLLLCTLIVAAVLQGGTTNWMVGVMLIGVYIMFAAGIWFHEIENLSFNTE